MRKVFISLAVLVAVVVGFLSAVLILLNHPRYGQKILRTAINSMNNNSLEIKYESGIFVLFEKLHLKNVIVLVRGNGEQEIFIKKIELNYDLASLFDSALVIDKVLVEGVTVSGSIESSKGQPSEVETSSANVEQSLAAIPFRFIKIKEIVVDVSSVDIQIRNDQETSHFVLREAYLSGAARFETREKLLGEFSLESQIKSLQSGEHEIDGLHGKTVFRLNPEPVVSHWQKALVQKNEMVLDLKAGITGQFAKWNAQGSVRGVPAFTMNGQMNTEGPTVIDNETSVFVSKSLLAIAGQEEIEKQFGLPQIVSRQKFQFAVSLVEASMAGDSPLPVEGDVSLKITQKVDSQPEILISPIRGKVQFKVDSRQNGAVKMTLSGGTIQQKGQRVEDYQLQLKSQLNGNDVSGEFSSQASLFVNEVFRKKLLLDQRIDFRHQLKQGLLDLKLLTHFNNKEFLKGEIKLADSREEFSLEANDLVIYVNNNLSFLHSFDQIKEIGESEVTVNATSGVKHGYPTISAVEDFSKVSVQSSAQVIVDKVRYGQLMKIGKPIQNSIEFKAGEGKLAANISSMIESVDVVKKATIRDVLVAATWTSPFPVLDEHDLVVFFNSGSAALKKGAIENLRKTAKLGPSSFQLQSKVSLKGPWLVSHLYGSVFDGVFVAKGTGRGNYLQQDAAFEGEWNINSEKQKQILPGFELNGDLELPWSIVMRQGSSVDIEGQAKLNDFSINYGGYGIQSAKGSVQFSERFRRNGEEWILAEVLQRNPFEKVDFERFQPFLKGAQPVTIEKIDLLDRKIGPLTGFVSINQNLLTAQNFFLATPSGGLSGELFLDMYPGQRSFGLLSRFSNLKFNELIPSAFTKGRPMSADSLSGRSGFVYSHSNGTVEGRVDVTQLSRGHMLTMIDVLDPELKNEKFNLARKGLAVGYPTQLSVSLDQGILDLSLGLGGAVGVLSVANPIRIPSLPVSGVISKMSHEVDQVLKGSQSE